MPDMSYGDYQKMTDRKHLSKAKSMPVRFLKASGKGFFIDREGYALAIREELSDCCKNGSFQKTDEGHFGVSHDGVLSEAVCRGSLINHI